MAPAQLFDISGIDLNRIQHGVEAIESINPHRGPMRLLDGVIHVNNAGNRAVAFHDVRHDEFWVAGHIPGRPLFPGVLMIETAAQLASYLSLQRLGGQKFMGFVAADQFKFRGQVIPGNRLLLLGDEVEHRRRRCVWQTQGLVNGTIVFEGTITGMPI